MTSLNIAKVYNYIDMEGDALKWTVGDPWENDIQLENGIITWRQIISLNSFPAEQHLYPKGTEFIEKRIGGPIGYYPVMYEEYLKRQKK